MDFSRRVSFAISGGKITILDRAGLERGACECVGALREKTRRIIAEVA